MSDVIAGNVNAKLEVLRNRFRDKAENEFESLTRIAEAMASGTVNCDQIDQAYRTLHRLAGSAGTFGFDALGNEAHSLELLVKPAVDTCQAAPGTGVLLAADAAEDFGHRIGRLGRLLTAADAPRNEPVADANPAPQEDAFVLIVEPDEARARELMAGLALYGYRCVWLADIDQWQSTTSALPSVVVVRDAAFLGGSERFVEMFTDVPIVCISATDSHLQRYAIASEGAEAFFCEPLNLPVLADHLENLLTDHADAAKGRVLIVDDDPELMEHYRLVLTNGGLEVRTVLGDPTRLLPAMSEFRPDIVLMDVQMGDISGPALARMLRFEPEWLSLPIIYLSAEQDRELQLEALSKGGDDFLTKPVSDSFLLRTVQVRCERAKQLDKLVSRDSLTGLLKHSLVKSEVANEHARCQRMQHESAVAMLDLDHFKKVNDTQGHRAGDLVIKGLANLLRHRLRKTDIIGRYGGEEFIVALPECSLERAERVMKEVCEDFAKIVFEGNSGEFSVTLSVGLAGLAGYGHPEDAIEAADQALYQRKRAGRNGVTVAGS